MFTTKTPIIDHKIPETLPEAQSMIRELLQLNHSSNEYSSQLIAEMKSQMKALAEKFKSDINKLNQQVFGKKSEVASRLFDEAELTTVIESAIEDVLNSPLLDAGSDASDPGNKDAPATNAARNSKKKAKRKVLPVLTARRVHKKDPPVTPQEYKLSRDTQTG